MIVHGIAVNTSFFVYIFAILFLSQKLFKNQEVSRKFVHIMLCAWWILIAVFTRNIIEASITPILFTVINYVILTGKIKLNALSDLIREGEIPVGTIVFPFSFFVMILLSHLLYNSYLVGGVGIVVLAMGDAAAALIGQKLRVGEYSIGRNKKTVSGSMAMFVASFISLLIYLPLANIESSFSLISRAAILGFIGTICEGITPFGLDNLTIPVIVSLSYYFALR